MRLEESRNRATGGVGLGLGLGLSSARRAWRRPHACQSCRRRADGARNIAAMNRIRRASSNFLIVERIRKGGAAIPGFGIGADRPFGVIPSREADRFNYTLPVVFEAQCRGCETKRFRQIGLV